MNNLSILLWRVWFFIVCTTFLTASVGTAGENNSPAFPPKLETLSQLLEQLRKSNPRILEAREKVLSAKEKIMVERSWDDPMVGFMVMPNPTNDMEMLSGSRNTTISQMVPLSGKKRLAGRIAKTKSLMEEANFSSETLAQIEALKIAFEEITYLDDALIILSENREILNQISGAAITENTPAGLLLEIQRIQTQLSQVGYDEALLRELRTAELVRINSLLNRPSNSPIYLVSETDAEPLSASLSEILNIAIKKQPELKMTELGVRMAHQETAMARKERMPDLTIGLTQQRNRDWRRDDRADSVFFDFNIPLWLEKNRGRINEAAHKAAAESAKLIAQRNKFSSDLAAQYVRAQNLWRTIRVYEDNLLPQAEAALRASQAPSRKQNGVISEAIEAQSVWLNFKLAHRRAISDYRQALARLETLIGGTIP